MAHLAAWCHACAGEISFDVLMGSGRIFMTNQSAMTSVASL